MIWQKEKGELADVKWWIASWKHGGLTRTEKASVTPKKKKRPQSSPHRRAATRQAGEGTQRENKQEGANNKSEQPLLRRSPRRPTTKPSPVPKRRVLFPLSLDNN